MAPQFGDPQAVSSGRLGPGLRTAKSKQGSPKAQGLKHRHVYICAVTA
jgi:hypothetical protein